MKGSLSLLLTLFIQMAATAAVLAPPAIAPALLEDSGLDSQAIGIYISIVYLAAALAGVYATAFVRRLGPIRTSQICLLLCTCGLLLMAALNPWAAALGAALLGCGYGPITPASSDILARTTPPERYALVFSLKQCGVPLGGAVAGLLAPSMVLHWGGRAALLEMAVLCLLGLAAAQTLRAGLDANRDPDAPWPTRAAFMTPIHFVLRHRTLRLLCICSFMFSIVQLCLSSYLVIYLNVSLGWSLVAAGVGFSVAQAAGIAGRIGWSVVADQSGRSMETLFASTLLMALATAAMVLPGPSTSHVLVLALLAVFGATAIGWNGVFLALVARLAPSGQAAGATAGSLFFTYLGVVVGPPLFGAFARHSADLGISYALLIVPLLLVLTLMGRHIRLMPAKRAV
jgi:sugar phosphate permease